MSIRAKLLISYTTLLVVTLFLFIGAAVLITLAAAGEVTSLSKMYKIHYTNYPLTADEESVWSSSIWLSRTRLLLDTDKLLPFEYKLRHDRLYGREAMDG
ncbi:hypothetical protein ACFPYJ_05195 [Paenibacillus solisilvae]|uniref:Uncharacterized protein n=1 Tax=Paenibacillus solisilvae TaxID=2486751 RepID=A0ABW0VRU3_9BACL